MSKLYLLALTSIFFSFFGVNTSQLLAAESSKPKQRIENRQLRTEYAYIDHSDVVETLSDYEQKISCYPPKSDVNANVYQTWIHRGIALQKLQKYQESIICLDLALSVKLGIVGELP